VKVRAFLFFLLLLNTKRGHINFDTPSFGSYKLSAYRLFAKMDILLLIVYFIGIFISQTGDEPLGKYCYLLHFIIKFFIPLNVKNFFTNQTVRIFK